MSNDNEKVGVIGVGRMGLAMLKHLVAKGYPATVCDLSKEQLEKAAELGAAIASSPAELAKTCNFIILGVGFDKEVEDVILGEDGVLQTMQPGGIIAISSTIAPDTAKRMDEEARLKGVDILDAPICRGRWAADNGTLLALVGGKDAVVERSRPIFGTFASDIMHLGDVGHGQVGKSMNNLLMWVSAVALIEAGNLAKTTGIDLVKLREALLMSTGKSAALEDWDGITFTWALKDMQIVADMSDKEGLSLPVIGAIKELVKEARRIKATNAPDWTGNKPMAY